MKQTFRMRLMMLAALAPLAAGAQTPAWPARQITLVVPYATGGPTDTTARLLSEHLKNAWGQAVVVENRPGANAVVGTQAVARAAPDGYTILFGGGSLSSYKTLLKKPEVDVERELAPISLVIVVPVVVTLSPQTPVSTMAEFIAYAKARPGKLNYGSGGGGNTLTAEAFAQAAGIELTRVNYKGESQVALAVSRDEVQVAFVSPLSVKPLLQAGKVKALALSTAKIRSRALPEVPTSLEAGIAGLDMPAWFGLLAPAGTPDEIRRKLSREVAVFSARADISSRLGQFGMEPVSNTPEEFTRMMAAEAAKYAQIARSAKIEPE